MDPLYASGYDRMDPRYKLLQEDRTRGARRMASTFLEVPAGNRWQKSSAGSIHRLTKVRQVFENSRTCKTVFLTLGLDSAGFVLLTVLGLKFDKIRHWSRTDQTLWLTKTDSPKNILKPS